MRAGGRLAFLRFSPLEERVLELAGEQWHTLSELEGELPEHTPAHVTAAVRYLLEHELLRSIERACPEPYLERTSWGTQALTDLRRTRNDRSVPGAYVRRPRGTSAHAR